MTLFKPNVDATRPAGRWTALGLCVAVVHAFALLICPSLLLRGVSAGQVIAWAVCYAIIVAAVAAAAAGIAFSLIPEGPIRREDAVLAFSIAGVWLAPLAVLSGSAWSIAPAAIAACLLGRSFGLWRSTDDSEIRQRVKCFGVAVLLQSGVAAGVAGGYFPAAYLIAIGCFLVALWMPPVQQIQWSPQRTAAVVLAIVLTAAGLLPLSHPRSARASASQQGSEREREADDLYSGFILVPEVQPHTTIVPPLPALQHSLFRRGTTQPLSIPFSGEYWIYHWPLSRPPKNSMVARGTPAAFKFTATGGTPLMMQARQSFGRLIGIQCCSRIDVAISNTDPLPGTVAAELKLVNTTAKPHVVQSIGRVTIMSAVPAIASGNVPPVNEILKFDVPAVLAMRDFDEIALIFHLSASRKSRSANVAVERFYLVPRGG